MFFFCFLFFANRHSFLYGRNEPLVRYCFLWLLYGRGERFVQYCFLWRSCADAGCHVYVPWVYHLAAKQGCTDVRVWLPKLGGLNIFCAHVSRGYFWASPFFFFFFVDVGNRTNVTSLIGFFCTEHILAKFGALRARSFNSRARALYGIEIVACMCVLACACERGRRPRAAG